MARPVSSIQRISQRVRRHRVPSLSRQTGTHSILEQAMGAPQETHDETRTANHAEGVRVPGAQGGQPCLTPPPSYLIFPPQPVATCHLDSEQFESNRKAT